MVGVGDDPTDDDRGVDAVGPQERGSSRARARGAIRQDREPDDVDVLVAGGGRDLRGREPDALVDDLHARRRAPRPRSARRRSSARRGRACRRGSGSGGRARRRAARTRSRTATIVGARRGARTPPTPVGARYSPNTSRSAPAHSPTVPPARASAIVAGTRFSVVACRRRAAASSARGDRVVVARVAPLLAGARAAPARPRRVDREDARSPSSARRAATVRSR